jgi:hypothetical protein
MGQHGPAWGRKKRAHARSRRPWMDWQCSYVRESVWVTTTRERGELEAWPPWPWLVLVLAPQHPIQATSYYCSTTKERERETGQGHSSIAEQRQTQKKVHSLHFTRPDEAQALRWSSSSEEEEESWRLLSTRSGLFGFRRPLVGHRGRPQASAGPRFPLLDASPVLAPSDGKEAALPGLARGRREAWARQVRLRVQPAQGRQ